MKKQILITAGLLFLFFSGVALSSVITTIQGTDTISDSRAVINTNFSNLNKDKYDTTTIDANYFSTTTINTNFFGTSSISTNYFGTTSISANYYGTTSIQNNYVASSSNANIRHVNIPFIDATTTVKYSYVGISNSFAVTISEIRCWTDSGTSTLLFFEATESLPNASSSSIIEKITCTNTTASTTTFVDSSIAKNNVITAKLTGVNNSTNTTARITYTSP